MSLLKNFNLEQGDDIIIRISARNLVGWSEFSVVNSDTIALMVE
jgi:hypothetical protein